MSARRNDGPWRRECLDRRGTRCRACGQTIAMVLEVNHVVPKSQGGPSVVENGLVLCGAFGCGAHPAITEKRRRMQFDWFDADQILWLHEQGWVTWIEGEPVGRGWRSFDPLTTTTVVR